jgi:penicillin-binding protein 1C
VIQTRVTFENGVEPPRNEWFVEGTQTPRVGLAANASAAAQRVSTRGAVRIGSPADGTIFALDPDIPAARQRISFERAGGASTLSNWRLDGKSLGHAPRVPWLPWPGHHRLELVDADGSVADAVSFEVRGAVARTPAASAPHTSDGSKSPQK